MTAAGIMVHRLWEARRYTAITVGGLTLGFAATLMMLGYVRFERHYDAWLPNGDRVFQVQSALHPPGQPVVTMQQSSTALRDRMAADFPAVEAVTAMSLGTMVAHRGGRPVMIDTAVVDRDFFRVFDLPFAHGDAASAMAPAEPMVVTESEARRWFGTSDVIGRTMDIGVETGRRDAVITGVLRDLPPDTSLKLGGVLFFASRNPADKPVWGAFDNIHYVRLKPGADPAAINAALPRWEERVIPRETVGGVPVKMSDVVDFSLLPLRDVHLGAVQGGSLRPGGDPGTLRTFTAVALLTLAMAIVNFANLAGVRAIGRAREMALRRMLGATRRQLATLFTAEALAVAAIAMLAALTLIELASPLVGRALGVALPLSYVGDGGLLVPAIALVMLATAAGGFYPSAQIARLRTAPALAGNRGSAETPGSGRLRTVLVVAQFAIAIGLIASTTVIVAQTRHIERVDPGYRRDGLIEVANTWRFSDPQGWDAKRRLMLAVPGVTAVGRTAIGLAPTTKTMSLARRSADAPYASMGLFGVDDDFFAAMGMPILSGRNLDPRLASDRVPTLPGDEGRGQVAGVVVNRAAAAALGFRDPTAAAGEPILVAYMGLALVPARVVGVVGDTRLRSAREAVEPIIYIYRPAGASAMVVRFAGARPAAVMAGLERVWRRFEPIPFTARFADAITAEFYVAERARAILFAGFAGIAIVIACLGLYGLAAFATERRVREIGIRKALGARVGDIVRLLAWQFAKPVVIASLVAWPLAWWAMRDWLNGFDARIALTPAPFVVAGLLALAIALATVAGHAIRAARTNPIHALRYE